MFREGKSVTENIKIKSIHVCRQVKDANTQQQEASEALDSAQVEVSQLKALAAERQKRFVMLNSTFKKKESGFQERAEAAERQVAEAQRESESAQAQALDAAKVQLHLLKPNTESVDMSIHTV